jgi:hypothetical protein
MESFPVPLPRSELPWKKNIPLPLNDFQVEFLLPAAYAALFIFIIYRMRFFHVQGLSPMLVSGIFLLKIFSGVAMALIYTYYYTDRTTADVFKYYDDSRIMHQALASKPSDFLKMLTGFRDDTDYFRSTYYIKMANWYRDFESTYNDSRTIIRVNAFLRIFSFGYFHVHTVFMCFISLVGLTCIYKTFAPYMEDRRLPLVFLVFFLPSVMFWGSGVLKESIMLFGLGLLVYCFHRLLTHGFTIRRLLLVLGGLSILMVTKYYILAALITGLIANAWAWKTGLRNTLVKYLVVFAVLCAAAWAFVSVKPQYDPVEMLSQKQRNFINLARGGAYVANDSILIYLPIEYRDRLVPAGKDSIFTIKKNTPLMYWKLEDVTDTLYTTSTDDTSRYELWWNIVPSGSRINKQPLAPTFLGILKKTPEAITTVLFRPHLLEAHNLLMRMAAFENLLICLLMVFCILFFKRPVSPPLFWLCISFVLILFAVTGLVTPVLGALVRYKMPALPFLAAAMLMIMDREKLVKRFPILTPLFPQ